LEESSLLVCILQTRISKISQWNLHYQIWKILIFLSIPSAMQTTIALFKHH